MEHKCGLVSEDGRRECRRTSSVGEDAHLNLEEVLGGAVDLLEGLMASIWHCLHCDGGGDQAVVGW